MPIARITHHPDHPSKIEKPPPKMEAAQMYGEMGQEITPNRNITPTPIPNRTPSPPPIRRVALPRASRLHSIRGMKPYCAYEAMYRL